jgi:hypothetical protein
LHRLVDQICRGAFQDLRVARHPDGVSRHVAQVNVVGSGGHGARLDDLGAFASEARTITIDACGLTPSAIQGLICGSPNAAGRRVTAVSVTAYSIETGST